MNPLAKNVCEAADRIKKKLDQLPETGVITGTGLVTPLGTGVAKTWENICNGVSGVDHITRYDASGDPVKIAAEVTDFVDEDHFEKKAAKQLRLFKSRERLNLPIIAGQMAIP